MLLRFVSDLHLEFIREVNYIDTLIPPMDTDKDTVLALLGDIHVGREVVWYLKRLDKRFKAVIYVLGNHEYYNNKFYGLKHTISEELFGTNVYVLENESITIDKQKFVGCTLWTDMENQKPESMVNIENGINDYHLIQSTDGRKLTPYETIDAHLDSINYLSSVVTFNTVVLTHYAPILGVSDPAFKNSSIRGGFESDLEGLIIKLRPKYWLYGHTHYNKGITDIENTLLMTNQLGYPFEPAGGKKYNPVRTLEI